MAWAVGAAVFLYLAAVAWGGYDGFPFICCLPLWAVDTSGLFVGLALLVGLALNFTSLGRAWRSD